MSPNFRIAVATHKRLPSRTMEEEQLLVQLRCLDCEIMEGEQMFVYAQCNAADGAAGLWPLSRMSWDTV